MCGYSELERRRNSLRPAAFALMSEQVAQQVHLADRPGLLPEPFTIKEPVSSAVASPTVV